MDGIVRFFLLVFFCFFVFSCGSGSSSSSEDTFQFKNVPEDLTILD